MKFLVILAAIAYWALCVTAQSNELPTDEDEANFVEGWKAFQLQMELQDGHWPATCDLSSATGVRNSACAVHCLFRGNLGGYCNGKGVCVCRN